MFSIPYVITKWLPSASSTKERRCKQWALSGLFFLFPCAAQYPSLVISSGFLPIDGGFSLLHIYTANSFRNVWSGLWQLMSDDEDTDWAHVWKRKRDPLGRNVFPICIAWTDARNWHVWVREIEKKEKSAPHSVSVILHSLVMLSLFVLFLFFAYICFPKPEWCP